MCNLRYTAEPEGLSALFGGADQDSAGSKIVGPSTGVERARRGEHEPTPFSPSA